MKDNLGDRMKDNYENRTRMFLPRRTNTIIRLDGKAFHTFTKNFKKPFDKKLMHMMDETAYMLCKSIQGSVIAYVQSDEISILLKDYDKLTTDAWYDGNIQKIVSVSASLATGFFNEFLQVHSNVKDIAFFDSRVFTIPEKEEVINYFLWRQKDAVRNSISMTAQSLYSHKELEGKSSSQKQEMCFQKGVNWNDLEAGKKRGRMVVKSTQIRNISEAEAQKRKASNPDDDTLVWNSDTGYGVKISSWVVKDAIDFHQHRDLVSMYLDNQTIDL